MFILPSINLEKKVRQYKAGRFWNAVNFGGFSSSYWKRLPACLFDRKITKNTNVLLTKNCDITFLVLGFISMMAFLYLGILLRVFHFFDHKIVLLLLFRTIYSTKKEEKKPQKVTSYIIEINVTLSYRYYLSWAVSCMFSDLVRLSTCSV
jgi:hypothetical protein